MDCAQALAISAAAVVTAFTIAPASLLPSQIERVADFEALKPASFAGFRGARPGFEAPRCTPSPKGPRL